LAQDGFLPRQLMNLGDRLVYSNGIVILSLFAMLLIIVYHADYNAMMPLYAIGVFLSFTLAQWGMLNCHTTEQEPGWQRSALIHRLGALSTGVVTIILALGKFTEGAWIVMVAIPLVLFVFQKIRQHVESTDKQLALPADGYC